MLTQFLLKKAIEEVLEHVDLPTVVELPIRMLLSSELGLEAIADRINRLTADDGK